MLRFSRYVYQWCVIAWLLKLVFTTLLSMIRCSHQIHSWPSMTANTFLHVSYHWSCLSWWRTFARWLRGMKRDEIKFHLSVVWVVYSKDTPQEACLQRYHSNTSVNKAINNCTVLKVRKKSDFSSSLTSKYLQLLFVNRRRTCGFNRHCSLIVICLDRASLHIN